MRRDETSPAVCRRTYRDSGRARAAVRRAARAPAHRRRSRCRAVRRRARERSPAAGSCRSRQGAESKRRRGIRTARRARRRSAGQAGRRAGGIVGSESVSSKGIRVGAACVAEDHAQDLESNPVIMPSPPIDVLFGLFAGRLRAVAAAVVVETTRDDYVNACPAGTSTGTSRSSALAASSPTQSASAGSTTPYWSGGKKAWW